MIAEMLESICICGHSVKDHKNDKCYELDFNGTIYSACCCTKFRERDFCIEISPMELEDVPRIQNVSSGKLAA